MASRTTSLFESKVSFSSKLDQQRFEFQESDIWISPSPPRFNQIQTPNSSWKRSSVSPAALSSSLPLSIPDWSKIRGRQGDDEDNEEGGSEEDRVAPHEYAARQVAKRSGMVVAYSLHQPRDLRRLRNAIWKHTTGFQD